MSPLAQRRPQPGRRSGMASLHTRPFPALWHTPRLLARGHHAHALSLARAWPLLGAPMLLAVHAVLLLHRPQLLLHLLRVGLRTPAQQRNATRFTPGIRAFRVGAAVCTMHTPQEPRHVPARPHPTGPMLWPLTLTACTATEKTAEDVAAWTPAPQERSACQWDCMMGGASGELSALPQHERKHKPRPLP